MDSRLFRGAQSTFSWADEGSSDTTSRVEVLGPDVSDRGTLLNLARAAWDAYHPNPNDDKDWYDIDGVNWVCDSHTIRSSGELSAVLSD